MKLSDFYPEPGVLIDSELKILGYLRNDPFIKARHSHFSRDASMYYRRYSEDRSGFEFFSYIDISHAAKRAKRETASNRRRAKPNFRLMLAADIVLKSGAYSNVTYCLSVCRSKSLTILRKFHFDVTINDDEKPSRLQQHPQCHLQYCGKMLPHMAKMGCRESQLNGMNPWLSEPRIFFWPMSLALLIDMALHEFPDEDSKKFRDRPEWRGLVRGQEDLILRPFYERCVEVIVDAKKKKKTLAEEFYVG